MISKNKISKRTKKKTDDDIVRTILSAKKNANWIKVAEKLSGPNKSYNNTNLKKIESETKEGDTIVIAGKVLGSGNLSKKIRVCAVNFSESAEIKIKKIKGEAVSIFEEINKNPKAEGVRIL